MTDLRETAQQMLKAWDDDENGTTDHPLSYTIEALRAALAQQEQEPVAWRYQNANTDHVYLVWEKGTGGRNWTPLYTHPPRREWQSLTEDEIRTAYGNDLKYRDGDYERFARAIEAKLKERNNG